PAARARGGTVQPGGGAQRGVGGQVAQAGPFGGERRRSMATTKWARVVLEMRGIAYEAAPTEEAGPHRLVKSVVVIADGKPVTLVLPAECEVNMGLVRGILGAEEVRPASDEEMARFFPEWDVPVLMDRSLYGAGDIFLRLGACGDAIRLKFRDWYNVVRPRI